MRQHHDTATIDKTPSSPPHHLQSATTLCTQLPTCSHQSYSKPLHRCPGSTAATTKTASTRITARTAPTCLSTHSACSSRSGPLSTPSTIHRHLVCPDGCSIVLSPLVFSPGERPSLLTFHIATTQSTQLFSPPSSPSSPACPVCRRLLPWILFLARAAISLAIHCSVSPTPPLPPRPSTPRLPPTTAATER